MVLKELILTVSTLRGCGGLERADFKAPTLDEISCELSGATVFFRFGCKGWPLEHTPGHPFITPHHI